MTRATQAQLQTLIDQLNRVTGNPLASYTRQSDGTLVANPGNYHLDEVYGGVNLAQMSNAGGGIHHPFGIGVYTKRELAEKIRIYILGLSARVA